MRILLVNLSPVESMDSATFRTLGLANGLAMKNCLIDYLTIPISSCHVTSDTESISKMINIVRANSNSVYDSINCSRGKHTKRFVDILRKTYHAFSIYGHTYSIAKNIDISILSSTNYDLIISSSDPKTSHIAVKNLIKQGLIYSKWIQYWGDPMTLDITKKSIYPRCLLSMIERKLLLLADIIVYVSPFTLNEQKKLFPGLSGKMHFLPIPYIKEKIYPQNNNKKFTVGYFGAYYSNVRNIVPLYNACSKLKNNICLNIVGDSDIDLEQKENIKIYPRGDISELEKNADLLVCLLNKKGTQIPGKIYHNAATNKPILVILDGNEKDGMKHYFENFNRFFICENNEESIVKTIQNITTLNLEYKPASQFHSYKIASGFINLTEESQHEASDC